MTPQREPAASLTLDEQPALEALRARYDEDRDYFTQRDKHRHGWRHVWSSLFTLERSTK